MIHQSRTWVHLPKTNPSLWSINKHRLYWRLCSEMEAMVIHGKNQFQITMKHLYIYFLNRCLPSHLSPHTFPSSLSNSNSTTPGFQLRDYPFPSLNPSHTPPLALPLLPQSDFILSIFILYSHLLAQPIKAWIFPLHKMAFKNVFHNTNNYFHSVHKSSH